MSEYQYYEFQAIDRPLTQDEMDELRSYSTRAEITPRHFINVYHWGDFKGDPDSWMEEYFDAFLYLANWGTRRLIFRLPLRLLPLNTAEEYAAEESFGVRAHGNHLILSYDSEEEESEYSEGEGWLDSLAGLRSDLMHGDLRALYLGWLLGVHTGYIEDDAVEPSVPPGLAALTASLESLVEFLRIDPDLVFAASEASSDQVPSSPSVEDLKNWVTALPSAEKDALLEQFIIADEPHLAVSLQQRALADLRGKQSLPPSPASGRRTVAQLRARAEAITADRRRYLAEKKARERAEQERLRAAQREKHLQSLAGKEHYLWADVQRLIRFRQSNSYDEAVQILEDLRDLADRQGTRSAFDERMSALYQEHARKSTLVARFRSAHL